MTDYSERVKALRCCISNSPETCVGCTYNIGNNECNVKMIVVDAAAAIEELQAKLEQCTLFNTDILNMREMSKEEADEILEYIRNAPVGPIEPMQIEQLPKHGEWVEDTTTYAGPCLSNYKCSLCGKICGTWRRGLKPSELPNWCGNCGADMRAKMEAQK